MSGPEEVKSFDLESKIREIIAESFEPVLRREIEDREQILTLVRICEIYKKQLENLEFLGNKTDKRLLTLDDLTRKVFNSESERRTTESEFNLRLNEIDGRFENLASEVDRAEKLLRQLEERNMFLDNELRELHSVITQHKDNTAKSVKDLLTRVEFNCSDLVRASQKAETAARESSLKLAEMMKLGPTLSSQTETLKKVVSDCEFEVSRMKRSKLEEKDLALHRKEWQIEVGKLKEAVHQGELGRASLENYVEKYLPMTLQSALSNSLHEALDNKALRRYTQYETTKIAELKNAVAEKRLALEELKQLARENVTQAEIRASNPEFREEPVQPDAYDSTSQEADEEEPRRSKRKRRKAREQTPEEEVSEDSSLPSRYETSEEEDREVMPTNADIDQDQAAQPQVSGEEGKEAALGQSPVGKSPTSQSSPSAKSRLTSRKSSRGPAMISVDFNFDLLSEATPKSLRSHTSADSPKKQSRGVLLSQAAAEEAQSQASVDEFEDNSSQSSSQVRGGEKDLGQQGQISQPITEQSDEEGLLSESPAPTKQDFSRRRTRKTTLAHGEPPQVQAFQRHPQFSEAEVAEIKGILTDFYVFKAELLHSFEHKQQDLTEMQAKSFEELKIFVGVIQAELESSARLHKRDRAEWKSKVGHFEAMLNSASEEVLRRAQEIRNMSQMIACLAEYDLISNSLMQQDELDRENIQLTGYRDATKTETTRQVVTMSTDCVSCSGQSSGLVAAFKMACLSYSPSQLTYRHRKFTRQGLLQVQAGMLQGCWSELRQHPPFLEADFAPIFDEPISLKSPGKKKKIGMMESFTPKAKPRHVRLHSLNGTQ
jgi:hypothetical protein